MPRAFQQARLAFGQGWEDVHVPGVGAAGEQALQEGRAGGGFGGGVTSAAQIVGYYLRFNGDEERMRELLVDQCGCDAAEVGRSTLPELRRKCEGFVAPQADTSEPAAPAAAGTTKVMAAFQAKQLSWEDDFESNPVPGVGPVGQQKLAEEEGVTNAVQLVGLYLMLDGDEDEFLEHLLGCGIRRQEIVKENGVLHAVREKVAPFVSAADAAADDAAISSDDEEEKAERAAMLAAGAAAAEQRAGHVMSPTSWAAAEGRQAGSPASEPEPVASG
eukprot:COSAG04_NODE_1654_length_6046_cov_3.412813_1_plen_273_part_10